MKIPEIGRVNWAIYSKERELLHVATNAGHWVVCHESKHSVFLEKREDEEANTKDLLSLSGWGYTTEHYLYVRPGFDLSIEVPAPTPEQKAIALRFGSGLSSLNKRVGEAPMRVIAKDEWASALKAANIVHLPKNPRIKIHSAEEYDEDHRGNLIYNQITGYYHSDPESDSPQLEDGFYYSRHGGWVGAAICNSDSHFPEEDLKLFFATLRASARLKIAELLDSHTFNARPLYHYDGTGIELLCEDYKSKFKLIRLERSRGRYHELEFLNEEGYTEEKIEEIFEEAINYLSTLQPGKTKEQDKKVLECLQAVEIGMEQRKLGKERIARWDFPSERHGKRLAHLLQIRGDRKVSREALTRRWLKLKGKLTRWEALDVKVLAADMGLDVYPSREWIHDARVRQLKETRQSIKENIASRKAEAERRAARDAMLASRLPSDVFKVVTHKPSPKHHFELQVLRDGKVVESHIVCRQGTAIFRRATHLNGRHYTRAFLTCVVDGIYHTKSAWLDSHGFRHLFENLGIVSPETLAKPANAA